MDTLDCIIAVVVVVLLLLSVCLCVCVVRFVSNKLFALCVKFVRNEKPRFLVKTTNKNTLQTKTHQKKSLTASHIFK